MRRAAAAASPSSTTRWSACGPPRGAPTRSSSPAWAAPTTPATRPSPSWRRRACARRWSTAPSCCTSGWPSLGAGHAAGGRQPVRRERRARAAGRGAGRAGPATARPRWSASRTAPTTRWPGGVDRARHPGRRGARPVDDDVRRRAGRALRRRRRRRRRRARAADAHRPAAGDARGGRRRPRGLVRRPAGARAARPRLRAGGGRDGRADAQGGGPASRPSRCRPRSSATARSSWPGRTWRRWCSRPSRGRATSTWGWPASWWPPAARCWWSRQDGDAPDGARALAVGQLGTGIAPAVAILPAAAARLAARAPSAAARRASSRSQPR